MTRVAVAGGKGDVGRTIVEVLRSNPKHTVLVLSRKEAKETPQEDEASTIAADYSDVEGLKGILEDNDIETVISCLSLVNEASSNAEVNLIRAASAASPTKRFIASLWAVPSPPKFPVSSSALPDPSSISVAELEKTKLEHTVVINGHFSDYYGYPMIKTYLKHADFLVDIANKTAAIPGTGDDKVAFTYSFDVAKFVDALISTEKRWPKQSTVIGDVLTINELVHLAESIRGQRFVIHHDTVEKLAQFQVTELPSHACAYELFPKEQLQMMFAVINQWITQGLFDLSYEGSLNQMFPHIKTKSVENIIKVAW
ncbi:hypothetical protein CSOJ01_10326 [Colletotrichum sojae]|uniref:NAD(P)-binding domain-containing protein n=1 Tax=Colletotrichum sojae TaxID=2175907 RepID=A0A8H6J0G0_9PEZI|nr:hypothetical protein CSOJ01_10326 [Colletotrichum sojae]